MQLKLAIIGCGAIAEAFHLPAVMRVVDGPESVVLVDPDQSRRERLAARYGISQTRESHRGIGGISDAAIIASPHHTHVPIAIDLIREGVPVLSEKPLGTSVGEVERLVAISEQTGVLVAVNQTRRFIPACREIARIVREGELGRISCVAISEGDRFGWPAATAAMFGSRSGGKGVLLDVGVHLLDLLVWWFGRDLTVTSYHDDSFGGSEAAVLAALEGNGIEITLRLSWLAKQRNRVLIRGDRGRLEWGVYDLDTLTIHRTGSSRESRIEVDGGPAEFNDLAHDVLADFLKAVRGEASPMVSAADALPSLELIETCYGGRERFELPWHLLAGAVVNDLP
jgi:predicted dehydrogenase